MATLCCGGAAGVVLLWCGAAVVWCCCGVVLLWCAAAVVWCCCGGVVLLWWCGAAGVVVPAL